VRPVWVVDVRIAVGAVVVDDVFASRPPECERGVQDLSCTGRIWVVDVRIAVGVAQALTPHAEKWTTCLRITHA